MAALRPARTDDVPALMAIRAAVRENVLSDPARVPEQAYHDWIAGPGIWLCEESGQVLGFAAADPRDGTVWALFVDPMAEGQGVGRALLPPALDDLRAAGWTVARLTTQPGSRAERFYRRGGWTDAGTAPDGGLILELALQPSAAVATAPASGGCAGRAG